MYEIVERRQIVPDHHVLTIRAPHVAAKVQPGQFIMLRGDEDGERVPLSVADFDREAGTVTSVFLEAGAATMKLARLETGGTIPTYMGPLGTASEVEHVGTVVLMGGCYGIGALYPLARAHKEVGNHVIMISEAHSGWLLYWAEKFKPLVDEYHEMTSDGSTGERGLSFDKLAELLDAGLKPDLVYSIGCTFLMSTTAELAEQRDLNLKVSLNTVMVDGTGMCGGCRCLVDGGNKFACVDGPEFDGRAVDWEGLMARRRAYRPQEAATLRRLETTGRLASSGVTGGALIIIG